MWITTRGMVKCLFFYLQLQSRMINAILSFFMFQLALADISQLCRNGGFSISCFSDILNCQNIFKTLKSLHKATVFVFLDAFFIYCICLTKYLGPVLICIFSWELLSLNRYRKSWEIEWKKLYFWEMHLCNNMGTDHALS
jgi:hypothetical protein